MEILIKVCAVLTCLMYIPALFAFSLTMEDVVEFFVSTLIILPPIVCAFTVLAVM